MSLGQPICSCDHVTSPSQRVTLTGDCPSPIPTIKNPSTRASEAIATSVGKGPYFAKKIQHLTVYIRQFHTLPPTGSGKHHAHPSLLNDERVAQAVRRYLTVVAIGEVRNRLCTIHMDINHFLTRERLLN
jgi:hypothetical protein